MKMPHSQEIAYRQYLTGQKIIPLAAVYLVLICMILPIFGCSSAPEAGPIPPKEFSGERAYEDIAYQLSLGPRTPGSAGHHQILLWLVEELEEAGWNVKLQVQEVQGSLVQNVIASRRQEGEWILLGAHYDTRIFADQDPDPAKQKQPVPGANDGASGVAVLLELARTLPKELPKPVKLVFFDAEDNGGIGEYDWIMGSRAYVESLTQPPVAVVILDMIGDADLNIYQERNSDPGLVEEIWAQAAAIGHDQVFLPRKKYAILDDHTPFLEEGIAAVDIIDFDYPYWHTTSDTLDKVSPASLQVVGEVVTAWLKGESE